MKQMKQPPRINALNAWTIVITAITVVLCIYKKLILE
ncbi:hypothetical protein SAMN05421753_104217 [Planctomicrobium piriforme]|uniref:Uncharacterized protein n=1 Tax=Planctomicrobium piriforme TaxID=1576369 RepID=A0A1I3EH61_9PLAN|nr:hypothetical protein SAMN05421753_104217 [Planctomicrobium piriforme]